MKFSKLVKIYTEAKDEKPGQRYFSAMNREGPASIVSGPIGKSDNFELRQPQSKWEYDSSSEVGKGRSGFSEESKIWKNMLNSFKLLFNDPYFDKQAKKISDKFNASRDSYKNIKGLDDEEGPKSYDEENQLEKLERNLAKYRGDLTTLQSDLQERTKILNYTKLPPSEKEKLEMDIALMEAKIKKLSEQMTKTQSRKTQADFQAEIDRLTSKLAIKQEKFDQATMNDRDIERVKATMIDLQDKIEKKQKMFDKVDEELKELHERINTINATNEQANDTAVDGLVNLIKYTASSLIADNKTKAEGYTTKDLSSLNWDDMPKNVQDAIDRLKALESDSPEINPILGYLERFKRDYSDKDFQSSRELDKNVNITKMRDFNRLPFMVLMRIYSSIRSSSKDPIDIDKLDTVKTDTTASELIKVLNGMAQDNPKNQQSWDSPNTKHYIKGLIDQLNLTPFTKDTFKSRVDQPWSSKRGKTPAMMLKFNIEDATKPKNESFDNFCGKILKECHYDVDDFQIDLIEILKS